MRHHRSFSRWSSLYNYNENNSNNCIYIFLEMKLVSILQIAWTPLCVKFNTTETKTDHGIALQRRIRRCDQQLHSNPHPCNDS